MHALIVKSISDCISSIVNSSSHTRFVCRLALAVPVIIFQYIPVNITQSTHPEYKTLVILDLDKHLIEDLSLLQCVGM